VADAEISRNRIGLQNCGEAAVNFPLFLAQQQIGFPQNGDARAVVAAIFQPPQSFEENWRRCFFPNVSDNAAHKFVSR